MTRPGRFLIATWDGGGNTPPAFNLGTRLARRGHRVRLLGWESMAQRSTDAGIEFTPYASTPPWPENLSLDDGYDRMVPLLLGPATRDDIITEARAFTPDVLVLDCMLGAGYDAARQLRLPTAVLTHVLYSAFISDWGDRVMRTSVHDVFAATDRVLALVPPGFDAPVALPGNTTYVGPITHPDSKRRRDGLGLAGLEMLTGPGDPWVLLSLSTTLQRQTEALPAMLAAVASLPVRVLLTLGGVLAADAVSAPPNVTVRDFVPHDMVMAHMAAVICHGGLSTITASLAAGVPLVCIPQGRDQHINAARVAACGVGRVVAPEASATEIATAVHAVVRDEPAHEVARRLAAEVEALGGGEHATAQVEQLAGSDDVPVVREDRHAIHR